MKRMKHILNGFIALAMVLMFTQCTDNKANEQGASTPAVVGGPVNMKIAYVEIDSLLTKYRYWNDLNEMMIQKEENIRTTLNEKAKDLAGRFIKNFAKFTGNEAGKKLVAAGPKL